jgi:hypothetical protein
VTVRVATSVGRRLAAYVVVGLLVRAAPLRAQASAGDVVAASGAPYLELLRTRSDLARATAELARADALFGRAMLSPSEHEERRAAYERARLAHLGALLAAATAASHVAVERAVKSRTADGRLRVVLSLRDASTRRPAPNDDGDAARHSAPDEATELGALAAARRVSVALKTDAGPNGATISRPYERTVDGLASGRPRNVTFELLEDVRDVVVALDVAGRVDERRIRLEVASASDAIAVDAAQFSLESDLGAQVVYDLRLQRPRPSAAAARLSVRGLPPEIPYEFRDPDAHTRLGQLRFPDGATTARVQLAVSLPARPSATVRPDTPLAFDVVAAEERAGGAEGSARLEVVPRGIARLELRPATLALQASDGAPTTLALTVRNAGSGRIDDVRLRAEPPSRWQATIEPVSVATLAPGDERRVVVRLRPPPDAVVGDYELRVGVEDAGAARRIEVEDKIVRVHLAGSGGIAGPLLAALAAIGLTVVAITHGRRWVNR